MTPAKKPAPPTPAAVIRLRERLQSERAGGIVDAQTACAALVYTSLRAWQQWERGERRMHPAMYELAGIKIEGR